MRIFFLIFLFLFSSLQGEILFQEATSLEIEKIKKSFCDFAADQCIQAGKFTNKQVALKDAEKQLNEWTEDKENNFFYYNITSLDGEIQYGYLILCLYDELKAALIYGMYIEENYRGCGIGTETLQYLETYLKETGVGDIALNVFEFNKIALRLYKKMGYKIFYTYYNEEGEPQGHNMIKFLWSWE